VKLDVSEWMVCESFFLSFNYRESCNVNCLLAIVRPSHLITILEQPR
jgi:hypothetical protein